MDREKLQKALTEYDSINGAALAEYDRIYNTAQDGHNRICKAAGAERDKIGEAARAEYVKIVGAAWTELVEIRDAALAERNRNYDAAWQNISTSVNDPLVSWIIEECAEYRPEALEVLHALPASLSELDAFASNAGWCGEWTGFRTKALKAGVITEN